jgi:hypothetical protein
MEQSAVLRLSSIMFRNMTATSHLTAPSGFAWGSDIGDAIPDETDLHGDAVDVA